MTTPVKRLVFSLCLVASLPSFGLSDEAVRRTEDVIYGRKAGMALTMDSFSPSDRMVAV